MVAGTIIAIAVALMYFGSRSTYYLWKILSGIAWEGLFAWWIYSPFTVAGSPTHVIVLMVVQVTGIGCFFWSFWSDKMKNGQPTGNGRFRMPFMPTDDEEENQNEHAAPTLQERNSIYQQRLDDASRGVRRSRR